MRFVVKVLVTAIIVSGVSELAKRVPLFAAVIASLPLTSILALTWLYWDTADNSKVANLSTSIFWAVFPSLPFFILLPLFLRKGIPYWSSLTASCVITAIGYFGYIKIFLNLK